MDRKEVLGRIEDKNGFDFKVARIPTSVGSSNSIDERYIVTYTYPW